MRSRVMLARNFFVVAAVAGGLASLVACEGPKPDAPKPCDEACRDGVAVRGLREMLKLVYNLTLQGKEVGTHDQRGPCLKGGTAHVFGEATSNAVQGTTEVKLTYELDRCTYRQKDSDANENYDLTITGTVEQSGTLAVSAGATTAIVLKGAAVRISGTVYDPPLEYDSSECPLELAQNGDHMAGTLCGRGVGVAF